MTDETVSNSLIQDVANALTRIPDAQREAFAQNIGQNIADWFQPRDNRTLLLKATEELSVHPAMQDYIAAMEDIFHEQAS